MNWARAGATLAAFTCLAALWLLAGWDAGSSGVLLFTSGTSPSLAREQIKRHRPREVLILEGTPVPMGATRVASVGAAASRLLPRERLIVVGWGLTDREWADVAEVASVIEPAPAPEGVARLDGPDRLFLGEVGRIQGLVRGTTGAVVRLIGPSGAIDSLPVTDSVTPFAFPVQAPAAGQFIWRLELRHGTRIVASDSLGISIEPVVPLRVLLLEDFPSFEMNALAGWLGDGGAIVERQTTVSRGREHVTAFNRPAGALALPDSAVAGTVDAVVLRDATLSRLSRSDRLALEGAVRKQGLGLVLLVSQKISEPAFRLTGASTRSLGDGAERRTRPMLTGVGSLDDVEAGGVSLEGGTVVARDAQGRTLAALYSAGLGTVAVSTLIGTDAWRRRGTDSTFARWWGTLLESVRGTDPTRDDWQVAQPVRADHRAPMLLRTVETVPAGTVTGPAGANDAIALAQDPIERVRWHSAIWPRHAGWHTVHGPHSTRTFYVGEPGSWRGLEAAARLAASAKRVGAKPTPAASTGTGLVRNALRVLLFLTLVAALGFLWWDDRTKVRGER